MHFKNRVWEVPSLFTQFVGYQNVTSKKYLESVGEEKASLHPIGTGPLPARRRAAGRLPSVRGGAEPLAKDPDVQGARRQENPEPPRGCPDCARAKSTSARSLVTTWTRR